MTLDSWMVSSIGRQRGCGWGQDLLDFLWTAGKNKGVYSSEDCEKKNSKGAHRVHTEVVLTLWQVSEPLGELVKNTKAQPYLTSTSLVLCSLSAL